MKRVYANAFKHYDKIVYCQTIEGGHFKELLKSEKVDYIELPVLDQDVVYYKRGLKKEAYALIKSGEYVPHGAAIADNDTVAIGAIIFIIVTLRSPMTKEEARAKAGIVYDSSAIEGGWDNLSPEEIEARLNEKVAEGMINISANTAPIFEDGSSEGNLMLVNESINNYPQKVQIVRNDTGEQIYESGAIAVGSKIERAKLDVVLPAGTYECTAYFHNLDPETGDIIGTAGAIITITIKN